MTEHEFLNAVTNGGADVLATLLALLRKTRTRYCVIGGLAVNAYAEPVVSLDLDIVLAAESTDRFLAEAAPRFKIARFAHSINLTARNSDLRVKVQTDARYQEFIPRATRKRVLGRQMEIAALPDVLQGKLWAYADERRRRSKRQKDLADIYRLIEAHPHLKRRLPRTLK